MADRPLAETIIEMIDADRVRLPVHPQVSGQATACLAEGGIAERRLWGLVGTDTSLVCGLLRAANSSFFAGLPKTLSIEAAVTRLGRDKAARVVAEACRSSDRPISGELIERYLPGLWQHARGCALGARWLARRCGYPTLAEHAYFAGLLHHIGKHVLLAALQTIASDSTLEQELSEALIREVFARMHVEQGLRLFDEWLLPELYRTVVAEHHGEELNGRGPIVALVRMANQGCHKIGLGLVCSPDTVLPTTAEAQFLGIDEIALAEFEIMLEDRFSGGRSGQREMADAANPGRH